MRTVLLNVYEEAVKEIDIADELEAFYKTLDCRVIDIVSRNIGGKTFDVMCDDEGLFNMNARISAVDGKLEPMLVGNLMFFHNDGEGNLVGLDDADIEHIKSCIKRIGTTMFPADYPILTECEY